MSDTPRTDGCLEAILDAYGYVHQGNCPQRWVDHSRQLERELNAANAEIEEKRKDVVWLATEKAKLENRINRLEETGDALMEIVEGARSKRWNVNGFRLKDTPEWVQFYVSFRKAKRSKRKEAKP
jgi:chromosome segregation ATPase